MVLADRFLAFLWLNKQLHEIPMSHAKGSQPEPRRRKEEHSAFQRVLADGRRVPEEEESGRSGVRQETLLKGEAKRTHCAKHSLSTSLYQMSQKARPFTRPKQGPRPRKQGPLPIHILLARPRQQKKNTWVNRHRDGAWPLTRMIIVA